MGQTVIEKSEKEEKCGRDDNNETDPKGSGCEEIHRLNLRINLRSCGYCEHSI
jgi:hypothetical protein